MRNERVELAPEIIWVGETDCMLIPKTRCILNALMHALRLVDVLDLAVTICLVAQRGRRDRAATALTAWRRVKEHGTDVNACPHQDGDAADDK